MDWLTKVDWHDMLVPDTSLLEIFIRGTLVYLSLFVLLRFVLKRQRGGVAFTDLLVIVLIADAAQNAMAGQYTSVPDGLLLILVIVGWAYSLDWLGYRVPVIQRLVHPKGVYLVQDGRLVHRNLAKENVTDDELWSQLRAQGVDELDEVEDVILEGDGQLSVVRKDGERPNVRRRREL
ncbi:uncharacterized membrane protein YcaP (DUF421 family) [Marmoricola sp. URHA0025 HA25]